MTIEEIKELVKTNRSNASISEAIQHERRIAFHTDTTLSAGTSSKAINEFLNWVKTLLLSDKYGVFVNLCRFPISTTKVVSRISTFNDKVFEGRNPSYYSQFKSSSDQEDWDQYREQELNQRETWREKGGDALKNSINSILIVDLPATQNSTRPEPYFYWLDIEKVIDFKLSKDNTGLEWIIFNADNDKVAVFDDEFYRVFNKDEDGVISTLESESPHDLGFCPARTFWTKSINKRQPFIKESPITTFLGELDWFLFSLVSERHLALYANYPIYWSFAQDCDFSSGEGETEASCEGGFLRGYTGDYLIRGGRVAQCPVCSNKRLNGAGSILEVDPPGDENNNANLRDPIGLVKTDVDSLKHNIDRVAQLEQDIYRGATGYISEPNNNQAINEKQVMAAFEGRSEVLNILKVQFEKAQKWVDETICKLRYGDTFVSVSVSYGTEFYLYSPETLLEWYIASKKDDVDDIILDTIHDQYLQTKYRNNPEQLYRSTVLVNLDPFRHLSKIEVSEMQAAGQVEFKEYFLKANFSTLIKKFERENVPVQVYRDNLSFSEKINSINTVLLSYINQPEQAQNNNDGTA